MTVLLELGILLFLLVLNGLFAMSEIAVVSSRKARLQALLDRGDPRARAALELVENPNALLSTVQIGITLIGILAGVFGGAALSGEVATLLRGIDALRAYADTLAYVLVVGFITYLSLVVGELTPKRIGLQNPENIALAIARPMGVLSRLSSPFVKLLSLSTEGLLRLLGAKPQDTPPVSEEEVQALLNVGVEAGVFEASETQMLERVMRLDTRWVEELMTPRAKMVWLDLNKSPEEHRHTVLEHPHSRFPVADGDPTKLLGVVTGKRLLQRALSGEADRLEDLLEPIRFVPENMTALKALEVLRDAGGQMVAVVDEYGVPQGILTLTDVLDEVAGDALSLGAGVQPLAEGRYRVDGLTPIQDFKRALGLELLPDEERYSTVAGLVLHLLGHLPQKGDRVQWSTLELEVLEMDRQRVDQVGVVLRALH